MTTSLRDRSVGAGYDYQWEVATYFLLRFVLRPADGLQAEVRDALQWLGEVDEIAFEGSDASGALEDLTLRSEARELQIQVKETDEDATQGLWRPTTTNFEKFMARVARRPPSLNRRILFLTNGTFHADVQQLLRDDSKQTKLYAKLFADESSPPTEANSKANWKQVHVTSFHNATPIDKDVASDGVGSSNIHRLDALGVADPHAVYPRVVREVQRWSFRSGGTTMSAAKLRDELRQILNLSLRAPGSLLATLRERMRNVPGDLPSAQTFDRGRVWLDADRSTQVCAHLEQKRLALIMGSRASGKTVLSRTVGLRMSDSGRCPMYWDFDHQGKLPKSVAESWRDAIATARIDSLEPMLLLENVHLAVEEFATILGLLESEPAMIVLATARTKPTVAASMQARLDECIVDLGNWRDERGESLVRWWLRDVLRLAPDAIRRAYSAVQWRRYWSDLVVLFYALEALDPVSGDIETERIDREIENRLSRVITAASGADEVLYLIAVLGIQALSADVRALGTMLGRTPEAIAAIVERAEREGLLSYDRERALCQFWHESLAEIYWEVFQRRSSWASAFRGRHRRSA